MNLINYQAKETPFAYISCSRTIPSVYASGHPNMIGQKPLMGERLGGPGQENYTGQVPDTSKAGQRFA